MGAHFGLGIAANGGDCEDCDHGDAADRFAFVVADRRPPRRVRVRHRGARPVHADRAMAATRSRSSRATSAGGPDASRILKSHTPAALARRAAAGRTSVEYAGYVSRRTQDRDVPGDRTCRPRRRRRRSRATTSSRAASRRPAPAAGCACSSARVPRRGRARVPARATRPAVADPRRRDHGAGDRRASSASRCRVRRDRRPRAARLRRAATRAATTRPASARFPSPARPRRRPGSFDGPQANPPRDRTVDNFRFHPDYRIDQILFREIIGTITDAIYLRPHVRATLLTRRHRPARGRRRADRVVGRRGDVDAERPARARRRVDPELRYASRDGFAVDLAYGVLLPGAGVRQHDARRPARAGRCARGWGLPSDARRLLARSPRAARTRRRSPSRRRRCRRACPNRDGQITPTSCRSRYGATVDVLRRHEPQSIAQHRRRRGTSTRASRDDDVIALGPVALGTQWYAASFPSGQFVVDAGSGLDGVYHQDDQALWLDGTASHDDPPRARR